MEWFKFIFFNGKKIKKCKVLLDIRDIWPESVVALGGLKSDFLLKMCLWLEMKIYNNVDGYIWDKYADNGIVDVPNTRSLNYVAQTANSGFAEGMGRVWVI